MYMYMCMHIISVYRLFIFKMLHWLKVNSSFRADQHKSIDEKIKTSTFDLMGSLPEKCILFGTHIHALLS